LLTEFEAHGFRNLESVRASFLSGAHLFLGDNGAGKTSLLEAVYLLATTRSFRTAQIADCLQHGSDGFRLMAEVRGISRTRLELGWQARGKAGGRGSERGSRRGGGRTRRVNGNKTSLAEHLEVLPVICWSSGDLEVLLGPPSERRRFIDRGVVGLRPVAIHDLTRYRQALHEKRQLLLRRGLELAAWNGVMAGAAASLIRLRASFVEQLKVALAEVIEVCGLGFPPIDLRYRCSPPQGLEGVDAIYRALEEAEDRERRRERPLIGPHRDALSILWNGQGIRRVASAGERKALGLALLAASGRILKSAGRQPIFLLDDADTELDLHRLNALWRIFGEVPQLFATSNRPQIWEGFPIAHRWHLHQGRMKMV